jgi:hypothetical protein
VGALKPGVVAATLLLGLSWATPALADSPSLDEPARPREEWYGWQTLALDGIAATMATATFLTNDDTEVAFWELGIGTYAFGPPLVHAAHRRPLVAVGDLGLRLAVPVIGLFVGAQLDKSWDCNAMMDCRMSTDGMIAGGLLGAALVSAADAAIFTYEPLKKPARSWDDESASLRVWPSLAVTPLGARASVSGSF